MPASGDDAIVQRAARRVSLQITAGAATIVAVVVALSVAFVIDQSRPAELLEKPVPGQAKIYIDSYELLAALAAVGIFAIIAAGVLAWVAARRAVRPLGDALRIQRTFVADASHELRTPLAVLDAHIQLLARRIGPDHELAGAVAGIRADARALIDVVDDLLLVAALHEQDRANVASTGPATLEAAGPVDVSVVLEQTVQSLQVLATPREITLALSLTPDVHTKVAGTSIRRATLALVDNALAHAPAGSSIAVALTADATRFTIAVTDHGPGIHGIDPARIFDRFAHADAVAGGTVDGRPTGRRSYGIGLSLVREIATANGGRAWLGETSEAGTTLAITLPRT